MSPFVLITLLAAADVPLAEAPLADLQFTRSRIMVVRVGSWTASGVITATGLFTFAVALTTGLKVRTTGGSGPNGSLWWGDPAAQIRVFTDWNASWMHRETLIVGVTTLSLGIALLVASFIHHRLTFAENEAVVTEIDRRLAPSPPPVGGNRPP